MADEKRTALCKLIEHWNESRLDMFAVSKPDENLEMHGIMRFFYQEQNGKCATKCIRVSSTSSARQIVHELAQKFRTISPNGENLCTALSLYECHENNQERILDPEEKPLFVQLNWSKDDREGRFVLRNQRQPVLFSHNFVSKDEQEPTSIKREQSNKRFSKNERKKRQLQRMEGGDLFQSATISKGTSYQQQQPMEEIPYTTFTRTISNPEIVMKRRREQKLENRIRQLANGGSLKIYGVELFPNRPYVTLLVSQTDKAKDVVQMAIEKYGLDEAVNPEGFVLAEVFLTESESNSRSYNDLRGVEKVQERYLRDDECPLQLLTCLKDFANVVFFLRKRPPQQLPSFIVPITKSYTLGNFMAAASIDQEHNQRQRHGSAGQLMYPMAMKFEESNNEIASERNKAFTPNNNLPCLVPINAFASTANFGAAALAIQPGVTEIGSSSGCAIQLRAPSVLPRHCCLLYRYLPGQTQTTSVQLTPLDQNALVEVDSTTIHSTVELCNGVQIRIGGIYCYRFFMALQQQQHKERLQNKQSINFAQFNHQSTTATTSFDGNVSANQQQAINDVNTKIAYDHTSSQTHSIITPTSSNYNLDTANNSVGYVDFERLPFIPISTSSATTPVKEQPIQGPTPDQMIVLNAATTTITANKQGRLSNDNNQQQLQQSPQHYGFISEPSSAAKIQPEITQNVDRPKQELPILLRCLDEDHEDELLRFELFADEHGTGQHGIQQRFGTFRLTPAFVLYAILRHRLANCSSDVHQQLNQNTFAKFINICNRTVTANLSNRDFLVFWLANASELRNMARADNELARSADAHLLHELEQLVQNIFNLFVESCRQSVFMGIQQALNFTQLADPNSPIQSESLLAALNGSLRSCRWALLNPALVIQVFSQLFHYISATIFNWLVMAPQARPFITHSFGCRLRQLLQQIYLWAQQQGLELSAECYMDRLLQTVNLLTTPKTVDQIATLGATCYSLNSVQVRYLLENYVGDLHAGEPTTIVARNVVEHVCALARMQADQASATQANLKHGPHQQQQQQQQISHQPQLAESNCLQLPFILPHDGYVVEKLRGIPPDMTAFVNILQQRGLIQAQLQQTGQLPIAEMSWNVFFVGASAAIPSKCAIPVTETARTATTTPKPNSRNIGDTLFPPMTSAPTVPPHQRVPHNQIAPMANWRQHNNNSPSVVYAEVQRRPNTEQQRCVSTSILHNKYIYGDSHSSNNGIDNVNNTVPLLGEHHSNERLIDGRSHLLVQKIVIRRAPNESLGLSIVEVATPGQGSGIYVKAVIPGSPAHVDGRIDSGDQLLSVNGQSLLGVPQEMAAEKIVSAGTMLHLEVAKKAAEKNGIGTYFQQQQQILNGQPISQQQQVRMANLPLQQIVGNGQPPDVKNFRPNNAMDPQYQGVQKIHSINDTSLSHEQTGINHDISRCSLRSPVIYGTPSIGQQESAQPQHNQIQHSQQSSTSSLSTNHSRLPAHYKPAVARSQVVVMQPGRPAPMGTLSTSSSGSSPINARRNQFVQSDEQYVLLQKQVNGNCAPLTAGTASAQPHALLSLSKPLLNNNNNNSQSESPQPINSSTTASTASTSSTAVERDAWMAQEAATKLAENKQRKLQQNEQCHDHSMAQNFRHQQQHMQASGRVSAPLFGVEQHKHLEQQQQPTGGDESPTTLLIQDVERQLDALDSDNNHQMSTADQQRYRELLERLVRLTARKTTTNSANGTDLSSSKLPPSMHAAAQHLERQSKSLAALSLDPGRHRAAALAAKRSTKSATNILLPNDQQLETASRAPMESLVGFDRNHHHAELLQEIAKVVKNKQPPAVPAKPAIRDFGGERASDLLDLSGKKRVQFAFQQQNDENVGISFDNNNNNNGSDAIEGKHDAVDDEEEPRVQIVGAHEVYMNDPRQKRLQELQANQQKQLKPVMDSSALGFREKMRIFAAQLGEKEPLNARPVNQHKNSSAERQIGNCLQ